MNKLDELNKNHKSQRGFGAPESELWSEQPVIEFTDLLATLRRRLPLVLTITAMFGLAAIAFLLVEKPLYEASVKIIFDNKKPKFMSGEAMFSTGGPENLSVKVFNQVMESHVKILKSREVAERVIRDLNLHKLERYGGGDLAPTKTGKPLISQAMILAFKKRLDIKRVPLTYLINITYQDEDRELVALIANSMASSYLHQQEELKKKTKLKVIGWLQGRSHELQVQLAMETQKIADYQGENGLAKLGGKFLLENELEVTLQRLIDAKNIAASTDAQMIMLKKIKGSRGLLPQNSIELRQKSETAQHMVKIMSTQVKAIKNRLIVSNHLRIHLAELERKAKTTRTIYESVLNRLKETQIQANIDTPDGRISSPAFPPDLKIYPRGKIVLAGALGLGGVVGLMFILLQEILRQTIRSARKLGKYFDPKTIVRLPLAASHGDKFSLKGMAGALSSIFKKDQDVSGPERLILEDNASPYAQGISLVKHKIVEQSKTGQGCIIAVMSAAHGGHRTTTALNLADACSTTLDSVLLVDCDLRNAELSHVMEEVLNISDDEYGQHEGYDSKNVIPEAQTGLSFCPAPLKETDLSNMDILSSKKTESFFSAIKETHDLIILDTSPMLNYLDTAVLIRHVNIIVLLVAQAETTISEIEDMSEYILLHSPKEVPELIIGYQAPWLK